MNPLKSQKIKLKLRLSIQIVQRINVEFYLMHSYKVDIL